MARKSELVAKKMSCLLGIHAFTGNDYVPSFFKKSKEACWKLLEKYEKFECCFTNVGTEPILSEDLFMKLQEYVAMLYGTKVKSVDEARLQIFEKKLYRENKIVDMSSLPPCRSVLNLYAKRANAVAYLWRNSANPRVVSPPLEENGWFITGDIQWVVDVIPQAIEELFDDESSEEYNSDDD